MDGGVSGGATPTTRDGDTSGPAAIEGDGDESKVRK